MPSLSSSIYFLSTSTACLHIVFVFELPIEARKGIEGIDILLLLFIASLNSLHSICHIEFTSGYWP